MLTFYRTILFILLIFSVRESISSEIDSLSLEKSKDPQKSTPMDWSKPVVSRGFGEVIAKTSDDTQKVEQYKSGQVLYFFGDYEKAKAKWLPLLNQNFAVAQASMGWLYQMGLGVEKDTKKAYQLYVAAAKQENSVAQNNLGVMYEQGIEVGVDYNLAREWYRKSAINGYRFGQYNYANLLSEGLGGEKNLQQAIEWYKKSSAQNVKQATEKLANLKTDS